jgi:hypothetical protein
MKKLNYALIKEIGENDVLLECNNEEYVIELTEDIKQPIFEAVEEGIYLVPFDNEKKKILMTVDTKTLYEVFPEHELEELKEATDDIPDEHK